VAGSVPTPTPASGEKQKSIKGVYVLARNKVKFVDNNHRHYR